MGSGPCGSQVPGHEPALRTSSGCSGGGGTWATQAAGFLSAHRAPAPGQRVLLFLSFQRWLGEKLLLLWRPPRGASLRLGRSRDPTPPHTPPPQRHCSPLWPRSPHVHSDSNPLPPPRPRGGCGCARVPPALAIVSHLTKDPRAPPVWALRAVGRLWARQDERLRFRPRGQVPLLGTRNLMEKDSREAQEFSGAGPGLGAEASGTRGTPGSRAVWASPCRGP